MHGNRKNPVVFGKGNLHPITMMGINIDIQHTIQPRIEQRINPQNRIIEVTKPRCPVAQSVMSAPGRMMDNAPFRDHLGGKD